MPQFRSGLRSVTRSRAAAVAVSVATVSASVAVVVAVVEMTGPDVTVVAARAERPAPKYVAMGSSYAAGPGVTRVLDKGCLRTADNYPHQVAAARRLALIDVTCSGAETANILNTPQSPHADVPQITAVTSDTALVTITVGGNDLAYVGRVAAQTCANRAAKLGPGAVVSGCRRGQVIRPEPTPAAYAAVERAMVEIVTQVRSRAPRAEVVLVGYPPLLDQRARTCADLPLTDAQAAQAVRVFDGLAAATARAASAARANLVTASTAGAGHTPCSARPWLAGFVPPSPFHPTALGKSAVAQLVVSSLERSG